MADGLLSYQELLNVSDNLMMCGKTTLGRVGGINFQRAKCPRGVMSVNQKLGACSY